MEIAFETYRVLLLANGVKRSRVPASLRIPRPTSSEPAKHTKSTPSDPVAAVLSVITAGHRKGAPRG